MVYYFRLIIYKIRVFVWTVQQYNINRMTSTAPFTTIEYVLANLTFLVNAQVNINKMALYHLPIYKYVP